MIALLVSARERTSSYLAFVLKGYELSTLVVHVDAGWNSELGIHYSEYADFDKHYRLSLYVKKMFGKPGWIKLKTY